MTPALARTKKTFPVARLTDHDGTVDLAEANAVMCLTNSIPTRTARSTPGNCKAA